MYCRMVGTLQNNNKPPYSTVLEQCSVLSMESTAENESSNDEATVNSVAPISSISEGEPSAFGIVDDYMNKNSGKKRGLRDETESILSENSELQAKSTVALSLAGASTTSPDNDSMTSSVVPTLTIDQGSDVTTLLSEVLSGMPSQITGEAYTYDQESGVQRDARRFIDISAPETTAEEEEEEESKEITDVDTFLSQNKHYFVLSSAGKPIYSMHGTDEIVAGYMGIIQTIVSYFGTSNGEHNQQKLKYFKAGQTMFVISIEGPLILVVIDKLGHSELQLRAQLDVLYAQILSTLTKSQISKVFDGRHNFDLRRLLGGTEVFLNALTKEMRFGSPSILLGALECLKLRKSIREKINNVLIDSRTPNLLYGLIVADSRLVSVIRPRRHSLHPPDLYLVFSMLFNTSSFKDGGEHWAPICLPKFNSTGFLYAYINFVAKDTALVLISPDKGSFFELRDAKDKILASLDQLKLIYPIQQSLNKGRFKPIDLSTPLIRHFLYKSKSNVQFVMPSFEPHFYEEHARQRLMALYHQLHGAVHGRPGHLKVLHIVRQNSTALAWVTPTFELYCVTGATTKEAISQSVRQVLLWIKQQEERLFVVGGAVF